MGFVVVVSALRMAGVVISGSDIQHADYWVMIERFTTPGGGLDVGGLFEFQNHPVVLPQLIYWVNIELFSGSNRVLGIFVCLVVLATIAILALIARSGELRPAEQMGVVALAGVLLFSLNGAWNFALAMSGTAWLLANLFVALAVHLRASGRLVASLALAVLAAATYGTGIMAWPALMVVGLVLRRPREWWKESFHLAAFIVTYAWYRTGVAPLEAEGTAGITDYLQQTARIFRYPLDASGAFDLLGWLPTIGIPLLVLWAVLARKTPAVAAWCGVGAFGWFSIAQVSAGRGGSYLDIMGDQFRYTSLGALGWVALAALSLIALGRAAENLRDRGANWSGPLATPLLPVAVIVAPLLLVGWVGGSDQVTEMQNRRVKAELTGIAWQLDLGGDASWLVGLVALPDPVTPRLRAMGHHPFVDGWDGLCGAHEKTFDVGGLERVDGAGDVVTSQRRFFFDGHPMFDGWVDPDLGVECVVVVDSGGRVVGGGLPGPWGLDGPEYTPDREVIRGIYRHGVDPVSVLAVLEDGTTVVVVDELSTPKGAKG